MRMLDLIMEFELWRLKEFETIKKNTWTNCLALLTRYDCCPLNSKNPCNSAQKI